MSCSFNKEFSWMIYGNINYPHQLPSNVQLISASLEDFNSLASKKLGIKIKIKDAYKICDFRPAFGQIFEDYIISYEFWGHSDLDIIYGKLSHFIPSSLLETFDIITSRREYAAGHFTLYRNCNRINFLYKKIFRINSILCRSHLHYAIDERSNLIGRILYNNSKINSHIINMWLKIKRFLLFRIYLTRLITFDMTQVFQKNERKKELKILWLNAIRSDNFFRKYNDESWCISWKKGIVTEMQSQQELMYFHFLKSKNIQSFNVPIYNNDQSFFLNESGFHFQV
jgi:hypothetical protein